MKRLIYPFLICVIVIGIACKKEPTEMAVERHGAVNFVTGDVFLVQDGKKAKANIGDKVSQGMKIETGKNAMVDIYFGENAIKVLSGSVVEVKQLVTAISDNGEKTDLYLEKGKLFSKVAKKLRKQDSYQIKSPTTIAAVRGTDFLVSDDGKKGNVATLDGLVEVLNRSLSGKGGKGGEKVDVPSGKECTIVEGKELSVEDLSESNKKMLQDILTDIRDIQKDIWQQFQEERKRILKVVEDQREANKELIKEQVDLDKKNVQDQIDADKKNINDIRGTTGIDDIPDETKGTSKDASDAVKAQQNSAKKLWTKLVPA